MSGGCHEGVREVWQGHDGGEQRSRFRLLGAQMFQLLTSSLSICPKEMNILLFTSMVPKRLLRHKTTHGDDRHSYENLVEYGFEDAEMFKSIYLKDYASERLTDWTQG